MTVRILSGVHALVRIFVAESDKYGHRHATEILLENARQDGVAGCTVLRSPYGYGAHRLFHTELSLDGAGDWHDAIEWVDEKSRLRIFLRKVQPILEKIGAFATERGVNVQRYAPSTGGSRGKAQFSIDSHGVFPSEGEARLLLRVWIGESDKVGHDPLYLVLLKKAHEMRMAGCTVFRGVAGFGASSIEHTPHLFHASSDSPMVFEIIDHDEKIRGFIDQVRPLLEGVLVTEERVRVHRYSSVEDNAAAS